jgi:hypothetical protein
MIFDDNDSDNYLVSSDLFYYEEHHKYSEEEGSESKASTQTSTHIILAFGKSKLTPMR